MPISALNNTSQKKKRSSGHKTLPMEKDKKNGDAQERGKTPPPLKRHSSQA